MASKYLLAVLVLVTLICSGINAGGYGSTGSTGSSGDGGFEWSTDDDVVNHETSPSTWMGGWYTGTTISWSDYWYRWLHRRQGTTSSMWTTRSTNSWFWSSATTMTPATGSSWWLWSSSTAMTPDIGSSTPAGWWKFWSGSPPPIFHHSHHGWWPQYLSTPSPLGTGHRWWWSKPQINPSSKRIPDLWWLTSTHPTSVTEESKEWMPKTGYQDRGSSGLHLGWGTIAVWAGVGLGAFTFIIVGAVALVVHCKKAKVISSRARVAAYTEPADAKFADPEKNLAHPTYDNFGPIMPYAVSAPPTYSTINVREVESAPPVVVVPMEAADVKTV